MTLILQTKSCYCNIFMISYKLKRSLHKNCLKKKKLVHSSELQHNDLQKQREEYERTEAWTGVSANAISSNNPLSWPCCTVAFLQALAISPQSQSLILSCISSQQATIMLHFYSLPMLVQGWVGCKDRQLHQPVSPSQ